MTKQQYKELWEAKADELYEVEEDIKESARLNGRSVITFNEYRKRKVEYTFTEDELNRLHKAEQAEEEAWNAYEKAER